MSTRWLVTGAGGMLGRDLVSVLSQTPGVELGALARTDLDITQPDAVLAAFGGKEVVVNAAAFTDVDGAETAEDAATEISGHAVAIMAGACAATGARLLHVSTDHVFAGDADAPYREDAYRAGKRIRAEQTRRRARPPGRHSRPRVRGANGVSLRRGRLQLRDHDASGWTRSASDRPPATVFPDPRNGHATTFVGHGRWADAGLPPMAPWRVVLTELLSRPAFADLVLVT